MTIAFDSPIIIAIEKKDKNVLERLHNLEETHPNIPAMPFMSYFEFIQGLENKQSQNKEKSLTLVEKFNFLEPTKKTAHILSKLIYNYEKQGKTFLLSDIMIASQAIEHDMLLVTRDKQFEQIDELKKVII